ncbi:hypothetical protein TNCV_1041841 [Trichonephila clavipes]|nr:hypothetical protein TNCV_1041841 [Trichonephila clavipes]
MIRLSGIRLWDYKRENLENKSPGSIPGLGKVDSAFHPYCSGSIKEYQACLGTKTLRVSLQTDLLNGTSAAAPQCPMVTYTEMDTVGAGPPLAPLSLS